MMADIMATPLNPRQLKFVEEYLRNGGNATQAYIAAGYTVTGRSAENAASRLLGHVGVQEALEKARLAAAKTHGITAERVVGELAKLAFVDPRKLFNPDGSVKPIQDLDEATAAALSSFEAEEEHVPADKGKPAVTVRTRKVRFWDKRLSLVDLGKYLGMFAPERHEHSGPGGGPIPTKNEHEHRFTLTPADLDAADRLAPVAGGGVHPDGGPEPVHPAPAVAEAASVSSAL